LKQAPQRSLLDVLTRPLWFAPLLLALAAMLSYVYADRSMPIPDEGARLTNAVKILHGGGAERIVISSSVFSTAGKYGYDNQIAIEA
jgi:hypothetical protein